MWDLDYLKAQGICPLKYCSIIKIVLQDCSIKDCSIKDCSIKDGSTKDCSTKDFSAKDFSTKDCSIIKIFLQIILIVSLIYFRSNFSSEVKRFV